MNRIDDDAKSDEDLADLVDEMISQLHAGRSVDVSDCQRRYPHLAGQIGDLVPTLCFLGEVREASTPGTLANPTELTGHGLPIDHDETQLGDFRIECEIGRGGMGVVYRARQITLDRVVAVKVLPFAAITSERQLARFKVEAQAAAGLHHPGIVPVYSVGCDSGVHYYAMQYIDGTSLAVILSGLRKQACHSKLAPEEKGSGGEATSAFDRVVQSSSGSRSQADPSTNSINHFRVMAELGVQAAEALEHAHQSGVIHRDIKPGNLLLDQQGKLWITDFGLARIEQDSELTLTGDLVGTLRYMSPEQANSPHTGTDHRGDVYSLGATLYEMLTLQRAFESTDRQETLEQIQYHDPVAPRKLNPRIPADLETIVLKAMEKDPGARYRSAQSLADDLRCFLQDRPISAKRPSISARMRKWGRRHPATVNSAITILILLALGLAISSVLLKKQQDETRRALVDSESNFRKSETNRLRAEQAIARSEKLLYVRGLGLAARAWRDGDGAGAAALMNSNPAFSDRPELRAFGWHSLWNSLSPKHKTVQKDQVEILSSAWSADGKYFASGDQHGRIRLWQAKTDRPVVTIDGHDGPVHGIAFHPDSQTLASVSADGALRTWGVPSGRRTAEAVDCHQGSDVFSIAFSQDGNRLVTGGADGDARTWETESVRLIKTLDGHTRDIRAVAFSPDDQTIATASNDRTVRLWDAHSAQHLRTLTGHTGMVLCVTFSRSGQYVISGSNDHTIRFWDTGTGSQVAVVVGHHDGVQSIATLPDGERIIAADRSGQMRLWQVRGKREIDRFKDAVIDGLHAVRLAPDGRCWAGLTVEGRLLVRDLSSKRTKEVQSGIGNSYPLAYCERLAFSPNGLHLYCADRILRRESVDRFTWDSVHELDVLPGAPGHFSPDGKILATGWNRTIRFWNPDDASLVHEFATPSKTVRGLRFSPQGNHLAAWFRDDPKIVIWDWKQQTVWKEIELPGLHIVDLEYSSDGEQFATCNLAGEVRVWDSAGDNSRLLNDVGGRAETIAWVDGDRALAVGIPGQEATIHRLDGSRGVESIGTNQRLWDLAVLQPQGMVIEHDYAFGVVVRDLNEIDVRSDASDVMQGHGDRVWSVSVSPQDPSILSASRDGTLRRWFPPTDGYRWLTSRPHLDHLVDDLKWSSDGRRLVVAQKFHCSVYDWPNGTLVTRAKWREFVGADTVGFAFESVTVDPGGQWMATGHRDGTIRIWDPSMESPIETLSGMEVDSGIWAMAVSADGCYLAACSHKQNVIKLWRTDCWEEHWAAPADDCDDLAFSPDGSQLVFCDGREAVLVDVDSSDEVHRFRGHSITVHGVAFSGDGRMVATACEDRKLRLWDARTGESLKTFSGHAESIGCVVFSNDDSLLVSGDAEGSIRLWDLETGQELYELAKLDAAIDHLAFDPEGNILVAITAGGRAHVFDGQPL